MTKQGLTEEQQQLIIRINEALAHAKITLRKTKARVAAECEVTAQALNNWLRRGKISKHSLILLAEATQVDPLWLYAGDHKFSHYNNNNQIQENSPNLYPHLLDLHLLVDAINETLQQHDPISTTERELLAKQISEQYNMRYLNKSA